MKGQTKEVRMNSGRSAERDGEKEESGVRGVKLEETRRGVEKMVVEETGVRKQASGMLERLAGRAKEGWEKVKTMLEGKKVTWRGDGGMMLLEKRGVVGLEGESEDGTMREWEDEWEEDDIVTVTELGIEEEEGRDDESKGRSRYSGDSRGMAGSVDFLEGIEVEEKDESLEEKLGEGRKRRREKERTKERKTLGSLPGWERRSKEAKEEGRWKRKVMGWEKSEEGTMERKVKQEKIPLPDSFDLGNERKGLDMNNSGRNVNNFGMNREPLFPGGMGARN